MANDFVTMVLALIFIIIIQGNSSPRDYYLLSAPKHNLGGQKFKADDDTQTVATRLPVTQVTN